MKSLKRLFIIMLGCTLVSTSLISCLDKEDDNTTELSPEETARRLSIMSGTHTCTSYMYYLDNSTVKSCNQSASLTITTDSIMTIKLPVKQLAYALTNGNDNELRVALENTESQSVDFKIYLHNGYSAGYGFYTLPMENAKFTCTDGHQTFEVELFFATSQTYFGTEYFVSTGAYMGETSGYIAYFPIGKITVNNQVGRIEPVPFVFATVAPAE